MKTVYGANRLQRLQFGNYATTMPATWYYALHRMNVLTASTAIGAVIITVDNLAAAGTSFIVEPGTLDAEERVITSVSGTGPYNLNFSTPLTKAHTAADEVLTDPGLSAEAVTEQTGGSYARASHANNSTNYGDAASAQSSNLTAITFPTLSASLPKATHLLQYDASSGGNCWEWWRLANAILMTNGETPKVNVGQLISLLRGVTA